MQTFIKGLYMENKKTVHELLEKTYSLKEREKEKPIKNINKPKIYFNDLIKLTLLISCVLIIVFTFVYFIFEYIYSPRSSISQQQAQIFQNMIRRVSICENKTPLKVHSEFRKKYNYDSYTNLSKDTYKTIIAELSGRLCQ